MLDYSRYKTDTLRKMRNDAYVKYYIELKKKQRREDLPPTKSFIKARDRLDAIEAEMERRFEHDKRPS